MTAKLNIAILLPFNAQTGGVFVVYIQAEALRKAGHEVTILFSKYDERVGLRAFGDIQLKHYALSQVSPEAHFDVAIASWWETFYDLPKINAKKYFYFVQSDERKFYPAEETILRNWCELTYSFPEIGIITEARWIRDFLQKDFGLDVAYAPNGIDTRVFHPEVKPLQEKSPQKLRVLIEGPGSIPFKRLEDAFQITQAFPDIEVWCVCSDQKVKAHWRFDRLFGQVPFSEMPAIYRSCDVLIKVSSVEGFFGPPLEMMATGGACIVSNVTGYDEYVVDEENALVIPIGDIDAGIRALQRLQRDRALREKLGQNGVQTANRMDWAMQTPKFAQGILELNEKKESLPLSIKKQILLLGKLKNESGEQIREMKYELGKIHHRFVSLMVKKMNSHCPWLLRALKKLISLFR